jgi:homoserine kinase type II
MKNKIYLLTKHYFSYQDYQYIADIFSLGKIKNKIRYLPIGFESNKVIISSKKGRFVISAYPIPTNKSLITKSAQSLQYEIDLLNYLHDLPVPHYVALSNNEFIKIFKGYYVTAYKFIAGTHPKIANPLKVRRLGEFLARFHNQGTKFYSRVKNRRQFYKLTSGVMQRMNPYVKRQVNRKLKSLYEEIKEGVKKYYPPQGLPVGPIHVDIKPENELFINDKLTGIIDFGISYTGPFIVDVAKTIMLNCCKNGKIDAKLYTSFLNGYLAYRKLTSKELSYLKNAIIFGIYATIYVDMYHVPFRRVPSDFPLYWVKRFLPVAHWLQRLSQF